jgi:hypothetical protein
VILPPGPIRRGEGDVWWNVHVISETCSAIYPGDYGSFHLPLVDFDGEWR